MPDPRLKIALIGTRGVPASHGGFETCVEEVGSRLAERGHEVSVYSKRGPVALTHHKGMRILYSSRPPLRGIETLASTAFSVFDAWFRGFDVHLIFNGANSPLIPLLTAFGKAVALNTDGLEWQRDKWGPLAKRYYRWSESVSARVCPNLISDSHAIHDYYKTNHGVESTVIAYGADIPVPRSADEVDSVLTEFGVERGNYFVQVTRFEPENHPLLCLEAFTRLPDPSLRYVLVGGSHFETRYLKGIQELAARDPRIILPGFIYDKHLLETLMMNARAYVHGNHVGGTNPALLQAMAVGRPVIAKDCVFNREVLGVQGIFFDARVETLEARMTEICCRSRCVAEQIESNLQRIRTLYNWDLVTDQYEALVQRIHRSRRA